MALYLKNEPFYDYFYDLLLPRISPRIIVKSTMTISSVLTTNVRKKLYAVFFVDSLNHNSFNVLQTTTTTITPER